MGGNTLPVFSSSSYDFQGQVVGERGTHEAATALAWTTDFVSHYRPNGPEPPKPPTDCEPTASLIDFPHGYTVSMCFEYEKDGETVKADAIDYGLESDESGLLYFFDRDNAEVLIKVLDGCGVNGHRWLFVAPLTTLAFNLYVESPDGKRWMHSNAAGRTAEAKSDTSAFACAG